MIYPTYSALRLAYNAQSTPVEANFRKMVDWKSGRRGRATHNLHPYPGRMLPQVAASLIVALTEPGDLILDPFCGSGTVPLEALLAQRQCVALDNNPFAIKLATAKTQTLPDALMQSNFSSILDAYKVADDSLPDCRFWQLPAWYPEPHLRQLLKLRRAIQSVLQNDTAFVAAQPFFEVLFLLSARQSSFADPAYAVPVRMNSKRRLNATAERHRNQLHSKTPIERFKENYSTSRARMDSLRSLVGKRSTRSSCRIGDSRKRIPGRWKANLVLTSPPYPGAQKYIRASFPALEWLEIVDDSSDLRTIQKRSVGRERYHNHEHQIVGDYARSVMNAVLKKSTPRGNLLGTYLSELYNCLTHIKAKTKPGGHIAMIVSPNRISNIRVNTPRIITEYAELLGMATDAHLIDELRNTAQPTRRHKTAGSRIKFEHVIVLKVDEDA